MYKLVVVQESKGLSLIEMTIKLNSKYSSRWLEGHVVLVSGLMKMMVYCSDRYWRAVTVWALRVWKGSLINALPDCCRRQSNNHAEINVQAHGNKQWLTATSSSKSRHLTSAGGCETVAESWCDQRDNVVPSHTTEAVNCIPWLCGWDDMNIWWPEVSRASNIFNLRTRTRW